MSLVNQRAWLPMAVMTALLLLALVFLYAKTQGFDETDYFEDVNALRHLKQLDAQWELDVLKSRVGINTHYDRLKATLDELSRLLEELDQDAGTEKYEGAAALATGRTALRHAIHEKAALIERFKSSNSVLRNSLVFLPTAAADVKQSIGQASPDARLAASRYLAGVDRLLHISMLYSQNALADKSAEIQARLDRLETGLFALPPDIREKVAIFSAHVRTILREQKAVNQLLGEIALVPTASRIDEVNNVINRDEQSAMVQIRRYRGYLLIFSAVLVLLLFYAAIHLVRNHAVIRRVNHELQGANEHLEQRVQERTQELRQAQGELVATARQAGMAEIATNVLHNVGNVLNSVNVSAGLVRGTLRDSRARGLLRAAEMMHAHTADLGQFLALDDKGRLLPGYLRDSALALAQEQQGMVRELECLALSIDHIKEIVATQQSYAGNASLAEPVRISDLMDDALQINGESLARHRIEVVKAFSQVPMASLNRARVLQIMVNLISNAKNAMDGVAGRPRRMTLRVDVAGSAGSQRLRISVADTGEGIPAQNLTRIFAHGFTTRQQGHGFGLHGAALAAQQMGCTLTAHSDGPDRGATFTLELPVRTLRAHA